MLCRNSLAVQWLGLCDFTATEGVGLIPGWGTKILQAVQSGQKRKKKKIPLPNFKLGYLSFFVE